MITAAAPADMPLHIAIRPAAIDDMAYIANSFAEGRKLAPGLSSMSWRAYKEFVVPRQREVLVHPETKILAAYLPVGPTIVGWLAYWPRPTVSIVHWVHVRHSIGARADQPAQPYTGIELRRRGIMTALIDAAELGRIAYTHRGGRAKHDRDGLTMDERLMPWLSRRGHHPAFVEWERWR